MSNNAPAQRALTNVLTPAAIDEALAGFTFVPSDGTPFITLDTQRRFYFNTSLRKMFGLRAYSKVAIGYNAGTRSIAVLTKLTDAVPANYTYILDKRHYASARKFVAEFRINVEHGPLTYVFDRGTSVDGVYIFRLSQDAPIDAEIVEEPAPAPTPAHARTRAATVTLTEDGRLQFSDIMDVEVYVNYHTSPRQLEVSTEHRPEGHSVSVGKHGLTGPSLIAVENAYKKSRPVTFELAEEREDGVRIYRKAK